MTPETQLPALLSLTWEAGPEALHENLKALGYELTAQDSPEPDCTLWQNSEGHQVRPALQRRFGKRAAALLYSGF